MSRPNTERLPPIGVTSLKAMVMFMSTSEQSDSL